MDETVELFVAKVREALTLLAAHSHAGPFVIQGSQECADGLVSAGGPKRFLLMLDRVESSTGAQRSFGFLSAAIFGLWVFPGLRPSNVCWSTFERDLLGEISKDGRKSKVLHCALHPVEMVAKYAYIFS
jgi:hypothetical protein